VTGDEPPQLQFPDLAKLELDELIDQLVDRAQGVKRAQGRLRALLHAIETITGDLSLEGVLRNVVEAACELMRARYGALGVLNPGGDGLEAFVHFGMDENAATRIGHLPQGKGLLGALIRDPRPIRLAKMTDDPRSTGFPPHHPPMDSFMGVPIHVRNQIFGNLYLADSAHGEFSGEDEQLLIALAAAAGVAISNARLYDESQRLYQESRLQQRWLEASVEIDTQMLASTGEDPLHLVARRAIEIAEADLVTVSLLSDDAEQLAVEAAYGERAADLVGRRFALAESLAGDAMRTGRPLFIDDASATDGPPPLFAAMIDAGPMMVLPLSGSAGRRGVLTLIRFRGRPPFDAGDLSMANGFAAHASVALELADSRAAEQRVALLEDRDRIARDLHDHVIQELFAIGLSLEGAVTQLDPGSKVAERLKRRAQDLDRTIRRIRTSIFQLRGNFLDTEGGLRQRVLEVATDLTPALGFAPHVAFAGVIDLNLDADLADDALACVREALTNVARHASATTCVVDVALKDKELVVTVSDDGIGLTGSTRSSGTANLRDRAQKRGGSFEMAPNPGGGTVVTWKANIE
jgi:signal transduction histidine kinase